MEKRKARQLILAIAIGILGLNGILLNSRPQHEVAYNYEPPFRSCTSQGCMFFYRMMLSNTGKADQSYVEIALDHQTVANATVPLVVRDAGKVRQKFELTENNGHTVIRLNRIPAGKRLALEFGLFLTSRADSPPTWAQVLQKVSSAQGEVVRVDPNLLRFGRFLAAVLAV